MRTRSIIGIDKYSSLPGLAACAADATAIAAALGGCEIGGYSALRTSTSSRITPRRATRS